MRRFKEGDMVRIKDTENTRAWYNGRSIGEIVKITNVPSDYHSDSWHPDNNKFCINYYPTDFELVGEKEHSMKIKPGDMVRATQSFSGAIAGEVYRVEGTPERMKIKSCSCSETWKLVDSAAEVKNAKFAVKYDREVDPVEFFKTRKDAEKRISELLTDPQVDKESIMLFSIGDVWEVKSPVTFKLVKV